MTYNGKEFDIPFILSRLAQSVDLDQHNGLFLLEYHHIDLFEKTRELTGKRIGLDTVSHLLGCTPKSGTGSGAIELWKNQDSDHLMHYCRQDVDTTEEVYLHLKKIVKLGD